MAGTALGAAGEAAARRRYHLTAAALAVGLALAPAPRLAVTAAAAVGFASLAAMRQPALALLVAFTACAGAVAGSLRLEAIDGAASRAGPAGAAVTGRAVLLEHPRPSRFGSSAVVRMTSGRASGARLLARVEGFRRWPGAGAPGTVIFVSGRAQTPSGGESFDWRAHLRRRGIAFELEVDSLRGTGARRGGLPGAIDAMRRRAETALGRRLPTEQAALARGMVLGQDERIDPLEREDFRRAGLAHVLAVSGQNVMLLCALALPLLGWLGAEPRARVAVLVALIAIYVPLAGAGPSLQRAGVMGAAGLIAVGAGRAASRWYALELAAFATLAFNPRLTGDVGWQLSFAAVAGILLLARPLQRALKGLPRWLAEGVAVTLAATIATAPLIAHSFGALSLAGVVANVVALPLVAVVMWIGMIQCALAQAGPVANGAVDLLGLLDGVFLGLLRGVVRAFADAPGANVSLPLGSRAATAVAYGMVAVAYVAVRATARRVEPQLTTGAAAWRRLPSRRRTLALAALAAAAALGWHLATAPPPAPRQLTVTFLDVGQGDATLIQDGHGAAVLFDGGPPEARVYRKLRAAGVDELDLVVSTHQSRDHQGGLREVLDRIPTRMLLENGRGTSDSDYRRLREAADDRGVRRVAAEAGQVLRVGRLTIQVLGPPPRAPGEPPPEDPNPVGVAAIVSSGEFDLWLSADAESEAILGYPLRAVEAMKVSHHGSADPGLPAVLERLRPRVAAIEVGEGNSYGHPTPETVATLRRAVPHVYRTDRHGTIALSVSASGAIAVDTER